MAVQRRERYIETTDFPGNTHLEVSVYYSKGGMNYLSGNNNARGFYLSIAPVRKDGRSVSYTIFSGIKRLVLPVGRYSEKQLELAVEKSKAYEQELIDYLLAKQQSA